MNAIWQYISSVEAEVIRMGNPLQCNSQQVTSPFTNVLWVLTNPTNMLLNLQGDILAAG
jgi:hypothetical protein